MLHGALRGPFARSRGSPAGGAAAQTWRAAVIANGGTVSAERLGLVATLVDQLTTAGVWAKLDRLWLLAAENAIAGRTDVVANTLATFVNVPLFTIDRGMTGNGTTSYMNTLFVPSVGTNKYLQNSAHVGFYNRTNQAALGMITMGAANSGIAAQLEIILKWSDGMMYLSLNDAGDHAGVAGAADTSGIWISSRIAAGTASLYRNATLFASNGQASTGVPNFAVPVDAGINATGTAFAFATNQIAAAFIGGGLTAPEVAAFTTALQTYMTAIGANV